MLDFKRQNFNYKTFRAENSIIRRLLKFGVKNPTDYISFHSLRNHSVLDSCHITELIYVHSKLMIVDDKTVIIGKTVNEFYSSTNLIILFRFSKYQRSIDVRETRL